MNDSLDDYTLLAGDLPGDETWGNYPNNDKKPFQAYELLQMNDDFMEDVTKLRNKYNVGHYALEGDGFDESEIYPPESKLAQFQKDIVALSERIHFPGSWENSVKLFVVGYDAQVALVPASKRTGILAKTHKDYIEVRYYGNPNEATIRKVTPGIKLLTEQRSTAQDKESSAKYRPQLHKSLTMKYLKDKGYTYQQIATMFTDIQNGIEAEDIPPYIRNLQKQVEKIYIKSS